MLAITSLNSKPGNDLYAEVIKSLYALNVTAVNQRYGTVTESNIREEQLSDITCLVAIISPYQFAKSLESLLYQMSEGDVPKSRLYRLVSDLLNAVCRDIVTESTMYKNADWD